MLKNLPPGYLSYDDLYVFRSSDIAFIRQDDGSSESHIILKNDQYLIVTVESSPRQILEEASHSCGEVLDVLKVHSSIPKGVEGTPATYYINRKDLKDFTSGSTTVKGDNGEEDVVHPATTVHASVGAYDFKIYTPIQEFIDLMNTTSY